MTKTKAQLRAEAVERLRDHEGWHNLLMAVIGIDNWGMTWQENREVLIDLLTDELVDCHPLDAQARAEIEDAERSRAADSREKLEEDVRNYVYGMYSEQARCDAVYEITQSWLDRQAAITRAECSDEYINSWDEGSVAWILRQYEDEKLMRDVDCDMHVLLETEELEDKIDVLEANNAQLHTLISELEADNDYMRDRNEKLDYKVREWKGEAKTQRNNFYQATEARKHWQEKYEYLKATSYSANAPSDESELARELGKALAERDMYRDKLGRAVDAAHEIVRMMEVE